MLRICENGTNNNLNMLKYILLRFTYSTFIIPAKLLASGLSGIAVIVYYMIDLPIGLQLIVYNIPIVYLAYRVFGKLYAIDTIIGTVMLSVAIDATSFIGNYHLVEDPILNSVFGGVLVGIGCGIVFRANSNGGGFDVLGAVIKKYYSLDLGTVVFGFNLIIILVGIVLFNVSIGLYTLINMYIVGEITNKVVAGFNRKKLVIIISPFSEIIGCGIVFRANSNGGGFDVLGKKKKKYYSLDLGTVVFGFNLRLLFNILDVALHF